MKKKHGQQANQDTKQVQGPVPKILDDIILYINWLFLFFEFGQI
jgi:hypothetical protein